MPDYPGFCAEWQGMLTRRRAMGDALGVWTSVLDGRRATPSLAQLLPPESDPAA